MADLNANPELLDALASRLRNASADLEAHAAAPPDPQAGVITGAVQGALALLIDALGNLSSGISAVGDATAESRAVYADTDYEHAVAMQASELAAEQPR
ncbi:hypothetical protein [Saccharopolyspora phatthalungensis]|uniref:ESX-1 secretion-associated protein n=1 Tax=Saccharopolyspora phatthalungensis TaxID=664693 RepID=A0A840Q2C7_9PSEU|nr:hypothetical protein [Saccharopolyspora phatthalungensis]MBB5154090.1 hypothetical protein [Saccharopolyspora phatthalungensis]